MKIRKAVLRDAATIADYNIKLAWETERLRLNPGTALAGVRAMLRDSSKGIYFVAESGDDGVIGQLMITYEWSDWRNENIWWIQSVYVPAAFRGRGVFKALFKHVAALAKKSKVWSLRLYVEKHNRVAHRAYRKLGMKEMYYVTFEFPVSRTALAKTSAGD